MKIGLTNVGSEQWIGGIYYISNLVLALRSLPREEQPEILLRMTSMLEYRHYQGIADLVELLSDHSLDNGSKSLRLFNRVKARAKDIYTAASPTNKIKLFIQEKVDRDLGRKLKARHVQLLFPCSRAMGQSFGLPWLPWIWDFQHKHYPQFFSEKELRRRDDTFLKMAETAKLIVTSSQDAVSDFDNFFPGHHEKFRVLHFRTIPEFRWFEPNPAEAISQYRLPIRYLVLPNQFWVHKNHKVVFEAIKILTDRSMNLHVVCTGGTVDYRNPGHYSLLTAYIKDSTIESRIHILGLIPRLDQIQIIRGSAAVIQPSLFEGWSTVVEDARVLGKLAFLSDIPVHREQELPSAVYFDPYDPEALADAIANAWDDLAPGPSALAERRALSRQQDLVIEYGRNFMRIANELLQFVS